jgi:hypothetical protein
MRTEGSPQTDAPADREEAIMAAGDTKTGDKVPLQDDDTFTIRVDGRTLKFKLSFADRSVELVSASPPPPPPPPPDGDLLTCMSGPDSLLYMMTSPKVALENAFLKKLSQADTVVFSNVFADTEDLKASLPSLSRLSKDMAKRGGTKPLVVFRVAGKGGAASRVNIDNAMRTIRDQKHALDAHIVSIPGSGRKSGL